MGYRLSSERLVQHGGSRDTRPLREGWLSGKGGCQKDFSSDPPHGNVLRVPYPVVLQE